MRNITDLGRDDLDGKTVLVRIDGDVTGTDFTRLEEAVATLKHITENGGRVKLICHRGRPEGFDQKLSTAMIAEQIQVLAEISTFHTPWTGGFSTSNNRMQDLEPGEIAVFENARFDPHERSKNVEDRLALARVFAEGCDIAVGEAIATAHRNDASVMALGIPSVRVGGVTFMDHIPRYEAINQLPAEETVIFLGGAKPDKLEYLPGLAKRCSVLAVFGGNAWPLIADRGHQIGGMEVDEKALSHIAALNKVLAEGKCRLLLPVDALELDSPETPLDISNGFSVNPGQLRDIGPKSIAEFLAALDGKKYVFGNGTPGEYERAGFEGGTSGVIRGIADNQKIRAYLFGGNTGESARRYSSVDQFADVLSPGGASFFAIINGATNLPMYCILEDGLS